MPYQVLARKWRPQQFDAVVGQQAVTRTLKNALASGRLAHAFVFAGPRGVGKTTTARILARALNCAGGPTTDPCGRCDACLEIAEGRDIDVLEIDAATHTGVDNVREVIIAGLGIMPVRDRYKIFIIDEVHQLSLASFNALLKSIEEPPPHVVFMMATTELEKIPETVLSRAQVHEFRPIRTEAIAGQLRRMADAEGIAIDREALQLIARDAEGSMRDAQSKLDQVMAFTGATATVDDVSTVLGLVGRDWLLDAVEAVAGDELPSAFRLASRAVEMGYDLRLVCRELSRLVRDLLVVSIDPSRIADPEIASESERNRVTALAGRFSREDLLRAFDVLTRAEAEIRSAGQPRYHLEMALLRWMYLRKLVPIEDLMAGGGAAAAATVPTRPSAARVPPAQTPARGDRASASDGGPPAARTAGAADEPPARAADAGFKDRLLAAIRASKAVFYNTVVAQAQKIDIGPDRVTFSFSAGQRALRDVFEQNRVWLESVAEQIAGRRIAMASVHNGAPSPVTADARADEDKKAMLREQAMADAGVKALLEVFPAAIRDVEEM